MKLDVECIREILIYLENNLDFIEGTYKHNNIGRSKIVKDLHSTKGLDKDLLAYAIEKMCESHIIEADIIIGSCHGMTHCNIYDISYQGHQFLDSIRPESIWEKTKNIANSIGNHSLKFIEDTAQKCAVTATAAIFSNLSNPIKNP